MAVRVCENGIVLQAKLASSTTSNFTESTVALGNVVEFTLANIGSWVSLQLVLQVTFSLGAASLLQTDHLSFGFSLEVLFGNPFVEWIEGT